MLVDTQRERERVMWEQKQFITVVQTRNLENKICEDSEGETNSRNAYETKVASCAVVV